MRVSRIMVLLLAALFMGGAHAWAADAADGPVVVPLRGHATSPDERAERAARRKAKIKAVEERRHRVVEERSPTPQAARGGDQIKAKMRASETSGKRATEKIKHWFSSLLGKVQKFSESHGLAHGEESKGTRNAARERKMSFKERLKLELERQRARAKARQGAK